MKLGDPKVQDMGCIYFSLPITYGREGREELVQPFPERRVCTKEPRVTEPLYDLFPV